MGAKNSFMNNIQADFPRIAGFAKEYGLPLGKKRAIIREVLQAKILEFLYSQKESANFYFVGGTSLRIIRGLDRFSEDLDFDIKNLTQQEIGDVISKIALSLQKENYDVFLYRNTTEKREYFELRFKNVLREFEIASQNQEKLVIKIDCENFWEGLKKEVVTMKRYGLLSSIVTLPLSQILLEKLTAYLKRRQTQPRDIYDIVWLISQGAKIDESFFAQNAKKIGIKSISEMFKLTNLKFVTEKNKLKNYKLKLAPFLINEENAVKLDFFPEMIKSS